ncbi:unnamed protein product [Mesocestoides corti]|uniref:RRM domain-containing protein n=1 Tax=Mesocestoides corti TaxID=53468 RepID=A0A0R3UK59_MESCO|nr:unnamed protein product [Mesocestoides corti]
MTSVIIRLQNLPISANASNIRRFFAGLNIPEGGVHIVGGEKGDAFIAFATDEDARRAMLLDNQQINSVQIRLFLSSKAEMQSVIETARSSVMMAAQQAPMQPAPNHQDTSKFPSQFLSSQTSVASSSLSGCGLYSYPHGQGPAGIPPDRGQYSTPPQSAPRQIPSGHLVRPPVASRVEENNPGADSTYGYPRGGSWEARNEEPLKPRHERGSDRSEFSGFPDFRSQSGAVVLPERGRADEFAPSREGAGDSRDRGSYGAGFNHQNNGVYAEKPLDDYERPYDGYDSYEYGGRHNGGRQYSEQSHGYSRDDISRYSGAERDFSVRPPWLRGENHQFQKRPNQLPDPPETAPYKRSRVDDVSPQAVFSETSYVVRLSMCPEDVSVKNVFEILRGVNIVPKWGIRVEEDALKRFTGNVYCMLSSIESHHRALLANGHSFHGKKVQVVDSTVDEFFRVTDSNFQSRCPPALAGKIPSRSSTKPIYFAEGCIELSEIPKDVTEKDIVDFLGVPGLVAESVKVVQSEGRGPTTALVRLPSARDLDILLGAPPRPFGPNQTQNVRLLAVSRMQFTYCVSKPTQPKKPEPQVSDASERRPQNNSERIPESSTSPRPEPKTCCFLYGFSRDVTSFDIARLFPNVLIPGDSIHILSSNRAAAIDFISENNCKKALTDFSNAEADLKTTHRDICMRAISRSDYEQKIRHGGPQAPSEPMRGGDRDNRDFRQPPAHLSHPPRGIGPRPFIPPHRQNPPFRPAGPPPKSGTSINVHVSNLPPRCHPDAVFDIFRRFHPLPGSLRFRRDPQGIFMGEALITFGSFADAERVAHEMNRYRFFGKSLAVRIHQQ